jgi:hypothetical protein
MSGESTLIAIDALDQLSRQRALTDVESWNLQRLIKMQEETLTGAARMAVWRKEGLIMALHVPEIEQALSKRTLKDMRAVLQQLGFGDIGSLVQ